MSHCAPEATLKPKRFKFTLKTVISGFSLHKSTGKLFQARGPAAKLLSPNVFCGTAHDQSVDKRSQRLGPSETQYRGTSPCLAGQRRVNETCQLEVDMSLDRKPAQLTQNWRDVVTSSSSGEKPSGGILDGLNFADEAVRQAVQQ